MQVHALLALSYGFCLAADSLSGGEIERTPLLHKLMKKEWLPALGWQKNPFRAPERGGESKSTLA